MKSTTIDMDELHYLDFYLSQTYWFSSFSDIYVEFAGIDFVNMESYKLSIIENIEDESKINELIYLRTIENEYMFKDERNTYISKDEQKNGIFGNLLYTILKDKNILVPFYKGQIIDRVYHPESNSIIMLQVNGAYEKPHIWFYGEIEKVNNRFIFTYYDEKFVDEANEKGASWLISIIKPDATNIHNYIEKYDDGAIMYEKLMIIGDREVMVMVFENRNTKKSEVNIFFVYDNVLVTTYGNTLEYYERILPNLTFHEVSLLSGKPLRETPGRYGTPYSTREYRLAEGVELHTYEDELVFYEQYGIVNEDETNENESENFNENEDNGSGNNNENNNENNNSNDANSTEANED